MSQLAFFDCNVAAGTRSTPRPENDLTTEQLLAELAHAGIARALAYHAHAREYEPRIGNERMTQLAARHPQFVPCYVLLPHYTGEFPAGDALLDYLNAGGARAVRLFPKDHNYGLGETWSGDLLSTLEEAGVPVLLDLEQSDWQELDQVLAAHPALRLILMRVGYRIDRWIYPLLDEYPGLHLETALYPLHGGMEAIVERFGAGRLVFGTGLPSWDAGAPITHLQYAPLDPATRSRIAGGNLQSLLWKETAPSTSTASTSDDPLWNQFRAGEQLDELLIIDAHTHLGPWYNFHIPGNPWATGMVAAMDACGIAMSIVAPHVGIGPDMAEGNALAAEAVERFPDRFAAYCTINPNYPEAAIVAELEKWLAQKAFKGIKIHPMTHDYPADGDRYRPVWEFAQARQLPVLIHTWEGDSRCTPSMFEKLGKEFTAAKIILGHSGCTPGGIREAIQAAQNAPNLYLDLTKSLMHRGMVETMVAGVGAGRILFGTDLPFIGNTAQLGHVAAARIPVEDKRRIFGLNAKELFGL